VETYGLLDRGRSTDPKLD